MPPYPFEDMNYEATAPLTTLKDPNFEDIIFEPYRPWQKGTCENANRDFRWYAPKGTNFGDVKNSDVASIESRLGRRPLKCLGYKTSEEFLAAKIAA
jgi:IS30 family transposase